MADTEVVNAYMAEVGFEEYNKLTMLRDYPVEAIPVVLNQAASQTSDQLSE